MPKKPRIWVRIFLPYSRAFRSWESDCFTFTHVKIVPMSTRKKAREVPRAPRAPKRKGDEASPVVAPAPALPLPQLSSDDKWGRRSFMAALGFGSATLAVGILAWRFPVT